MTANRNRQALAGIFLETYRANLLEARAFVEHTETVEFRKRFADDDATQGRIVKAKTRQQREIIAQEVAMAAGIADAILVAVAVFSSPSESSLRDGQICSGLS